MIQAHDACIAYNGIRQWAIGKEPHLVDKEEMTNRARIFKRLRSPGIDSKNEFRQPM
jgi:hypothetical protein